MKAAQRICIVFLLALFVHGFAAAADLVGKWKVHDPQSPIKSGKFILQFIKGGKLKMFVESPQMKVVIDGMYQLAGSKLTLRMTSQTANGKKVAASRESLVWNVRWKNKDLVYMSDAKKPKKVPVVLTRIK